MSAEGNRWAWRRFGIGRGERTLGRVSLAEEW